MDLIDFTTDNGCDDDDENADYSGYLNYLYGNYDRDNDEDCGMEE